MDRGPGDRAVHDVAGAEVLNKRDHRPLATSQVDA